MPSILRRELRYLNIETDSSISIMATIGTATAIASPKEFILILFTVNINPCTTEGSKLYLKATKALPCNARFTMSLEYRPAIRDNLESN